ncbi:MAG: hypothetical protein QOC96_954 [Acidobacteriota bacterium]|jgi:hypothetical protein|nr:hypothetical protein [Acidobacteriota bacterium]
MSKTIAPDMPADENVNYEEAVNQMFGEMKQSNKKMARDQEEIDRLRMETREILARLKAA